MDIIRCFEPECQNEADHYCNCTSPETHFCKFHYADHCISNIGPHTLNSRFLIPIKITKNAILGLLDEEVSKTNILKTEILDSFNRIFKRYEKILKMILNEIDSKIENTSIYYEKVLKAKRVSRVESDEILNMLLLQPNEVAEKFKTIFTTNLNDISELAYKMNDEISKILKNFNNEELKNDEEKTDASTYGDIFFNNEELKNDEEKTDASTYGDFFDDYICLSELSCFKWESKDFVTINLDTLQVSSITTLPIQESTKWMASCILYDKTYFYCCSHDSKTGSTFTIVKYKNVKRLQNSKHNCFCDAILYKNFIYVIGGTYKLAERYDIKRNIWQSMAPINQNFDFGHSCSMLYKDLILITAYYMRNIIIYSIAQNNYQEVQNLVLNNNCFKLVLKGNNRAYVFEKSGRTFESSENNISSWTQIGNNNIVNSAKQSNFVRYKDCLYFATNSNRLYKFDLSSKHVSLVANF